MLSNTLDSRFYKEAKGIDFEELEYPDVDAQVAKKRQLAREGRVRIM